MKVLATEFVELWKELEQKLVLKSKPEDFC